MPTLGHLIFSLCLLIPILHYSKDKKFNHKVAFIFLANNIFGPDSVLLFFITPFHSLLGFIIYAIPLSLAFSYSSRFSLKKSEKKIFPLIFVDEGIRDVKWKNAYYVTVAGGISHFFIDQFFHWEREMNIFRGIAITHDEMLSWGGATYHSFTPIMIVGELIVVTTILLSLYCFSNSNAAKKTFILLIVVIGISVALMVGWTTNVFSGEREFAVILFAILYILIPLFLLMHVAKDVRDNPNVTPDEPKIKRNNLLYIVATISISMSLFFILYANFAIINSKAIASVLVKDNGGDIYETTKSVAIIGYIFLVVSVILLINSIGLFFKINICRYITIVICSFFLIFGFPFAIALFLCEKDVKQLFGKDPKN